MEDKTLRNMDVVYVVREGEDNESLRYSLRSVAENLPHNRVVIAGYVPRWLRHFNYVLRNQQDKPDQENSNANLLAALQLPWLSDDFIFMNDDFFITEPMTSIPTLHQGSLDARIAAYETGNRMHQAYSLITTRRALVATGLARDKLLSYELHMPMVMNRKKALAMFEYWDQPLFSLRPRTMYGNLFAIGGKETKDAKGVTQPIEGFISTSSGFDGPAATGIKLKFATRCRYEAPEPDGWPGQ
jgi:hypothetical protein